MYKEIIQVDELVSYSYHFVMNFPYYTISFLYFFLLTENVSRVGIIFCTYFLSTINVFRVGIIVKNNFRLVKNNCSNHFGVWGLVIA